MIYKEQNCTFRNGRLIRAFDNDFIYERYDFY